MVSLPGLDAVVERGRPLFKMLAGGHLFITGGTGFFGRWLLETISAANQGLSTDIRVTVLSRDPDRFLSGARHLDQSWLR